MSSLCHEFLTIFEQPMNWFLLLGGFYTLQKIEPLLSQPYWVTSVWRGMLPPVDHPLLDLQKIRRFDCCEASHRWKTSLSASTEPQMNSRHHGRHGKAAAPNWKAHDRQNNGRRVFFLLQIAACVPVSRPQLFISFVLDSVADAFATNLL